MLQIGAAAQATMWHLDYLKTWVILYKLHITNIFFNFVLSVHLPYLQKTIKKVKNSLLGLLV